MLDADFFRRWMTATAASVAREAERLTDLDSPIGDAAEVSDEEFALALRTGVDAVMTLGGAAPGDKTMIDALVPAVDALPDGFAAARAAAEEGAVATTPLQAHKGRASYLGERSIGHQDPGATSSSLLIAALQEAESTEATGE